MRKSIVAAMLFASCLSAPAHADVLTIGTPNGGNSFPFGNGSGAGTRYQQVYNNTNFANAINILSVSFRANSGSTLAGGVYTLGASTTSAGVGALSGAFGNNIGGDSQTVFSGTLAPNFSNGLLTFVFSTPFAYNPSLGNLLLDFQIASPTAGFIFFDAMNGNSGNLFSRAHNFGTGTSGFGLVTTFETAALTAGGVPEPLTWTMLILGFGLVGGAMRRRAQVTTRVTFA